MAEKYTNLIEFIVSKVYENDEHKISGESLQQALLALVADLGKYMQIGGMVTPEGNPEVGDAPVIFIADQPGEYLNYGGLTVDEGELALLVYEPEEWRKITLPVLSSENGAVKGNHIAEGAISESKIQNGAVTNDKLDDGAVTNPKIGNEAVTPDKLKQSIVTVEAAKIYPNYFLHVDTGVLQSSNGFTVNEYSITPNKQYLVTGSTGAGAGSCVGSFYDANFNHISDILASRYYPSQKWERYAVTSPANAVYMRVQTSSNSNPRPKLEYKTNLYELVEKLLPGNLLYGKKIAFCGDSNTAGDFDGYTGQKTFPDGRFVGEKMVYPRFIAERNNMQLYMDAIGGSIVGLSKAYVDDPDNVDINTRDPFSNGRYLNVPQDSDYLILWFGGNDLPGEEYTGTINDANNETLYGAWNVILSYYLTNMPFTKIGIIIPYTSTSTIRQVIRDVAEKWGVPYLDMTGDNQVPLMYAKESSLNVSQDAIDMRRAAFCCSAENAHMSPPAHKYQSTFIESWIRTL